MIITLMLSGASGQALADSYTPATSQATTQIVDSATSVSTAINNTSYLAAEPLAASATLDTLIDPITHKSVANSYPLEVSSFLSLEQAQNTYFKCRRNSLQIKPLSPLANIRQTPLRQ